MISSFFDRVILEYPKIVIVCLLAVVVFFAIEAKQFRLDASADTLVLQNDKDLLYSRVISSRYGQQDSLILTFTPKDELFSPQTLAVLSRLQDELESLERVFSVVSILDVPLLESPPLSLKQLTEELPTLSSAQIDLDLAKKEFRDSPIYQDLLVSRDLQTTAILINLLDDDSYRSLRDRRSTLLGEQAARSLAEAEQVELDHLAEQLQQYSDTLKRQRHQNIVAIRKIIDTYRGEGELFLGGVGMIADDMITFIKNDLKYFGAGVLFFLTLMLGIIFRKIRWICLPLLCSVVSIVIMAGLLGWLGWKVTVVSSNFISLQLIITTALTIHLIVRYRELREQHPQAPNRELISETIRLMLKPCFYTTLTTIAGFASLAFCDMLPVIMFGRMMMLGLVISLVVTFLLFPVIVVLMPKDSPADRKKPRFSMTSALAGFTESHSALILTVSAVVLMVSVIGMSKLRVENSFIDYFKKTSEIYKGMKVIDQSLGGTTPLDVLIDFAASEALPETPDAATPADDDVFDEFAEFDAAASEDKYWFTADKMSRIKSVHAYLDGLPETGKVMSLATVLRVAEQLTDGNPLDSFELALLYSETPDSFRDMLVEPYISVEDNQARFWVRIKDSEKTLRRDELLKKIRKDLPGILGFSQDHVHLAGMMVLYNNMLQSLFGSQAVTLGLTVLVLMVMFLILFRSLKISVIALIPNVLPVLVMLGVMGWLDIPLDMMTITIAAISLGIAVDDTIHYIHRFKYEFKKDHHYLSTMHRCHGSIGHAMYNTSVTIIIGFSVLTVSNFIPTVYFGLLTVLVMLTAILAALTFLPVMLILFKPFGKES